MKEDLKDVQFHPIIMTDFREFFVDYKFNGRSLNNKERQDVIQVFNRVISDYKSGLPLVYDSLSCYKGRTDPFGILNYTIDSIYLFSLITMLDFHIVGKQFISTDDDYEKRFMRGKMFVILNEGFKKLYGFNGNNHKKSEWAKLTPLFEYFPKVIQQQYIDLTYNLDMLSKTSTWWEQERCWETHIDAESLYASRNEPLNESQVMIESLKLYGALRAVNLFLKNAGAILTNTLIEKYRNGELTDQ